MIDRKIDRENYEGLLANTEDNLTKVDRYIDRKIDRENYDGLLYWG